MIARGVVEIRKAEQTVDTRSRIAFWLVSAVVAVLLLLRSGTVPLMDPDEARFARTSVEMLRSGDVVVPTFEGAPRLVKPPLLHWIQASLFRWLEVSEFAARLPAILSTLASLYLVGFVVRRRFGEEGAAWAAAIFATMPIVIVEGKAGTLDALLSVHILAAVALDIAEPGETGPYRGAAIGALMGLGFLAKGPVGVILPLLIMLAGRTASQKTLLPRRSAALWAGAAWAVVVLPWGLAFLERVGIGGAMGTIRREALERYFAGSEHIEPPWYFAQVALVAFLPWLAPLALGLVRVLGRRRDPAARTALYAAAGFLAGLLFFSLGRGKLASYILPLAPLAAIVVTWELGQELAAPRERLLGPGLLVLTLVGLALVLGGEAALRPEDEYSSTGLLGAAFFAVGALGALVGMVAKRTRWVYGSAAGASLAFLLAAAGLMLPVLASSRSAAPLVRAMPVLFSDRPLVLVDMRMPSMTFYLDRVPEKVAMAELAERLDRDDAPLLVVKDIDLPRMDRSLLARLRRVGQMGRYSIYEEEEEEEDGEGEHPAKNVDRPLDGPSGAG